MKMLIYEILKEHAERNPEKEAIAFHGRRYNYREYREAVDRDAANMLKLGVRRGDKVALYVGNSPEFVFMYIATMSIGAAAVPVSVRFGAKEAGFIVGNSDSSLLVTVPGFAGADFLQFVNEFLPGCPEVKKVVVLGTDEEVARVNGALAGDALFGEPSREEMEALAAARGEVEEGDVGFFVYTSGTTGVPKAAMLTQRNLVSYVRGQVDASDVSGNDRLLLDIPVNHVGGGVMAILSMLYVGGTLVILDAFIPQEVMQTVQDERITIMGQVPAQYILLMMLPDFDKYDVSSVRAAVVAAAPSPRELFGQVKEKFGVYLTNGYGLSEVCGAVTFTRVDEDSYERLSTSIGKPNEGIEVAILDSAGNRLPEGEEGEICIRGDAVMKGYYKMPEETANVMTPDGFFRTGDMGKMDSDGYVYILGRKKEMYIRGGENVYPPEIEEVIQEHPKVLFTAVIGVPDPVMGEEGKAFIVPQPGLEEPLSEEEVKEWCRGRLAKYKVPRYVEFRDSLPLTPLGKVMKKLLYEEIQSGGGAGKPAKKAAGKAAGKPAKKAAGKAAGKPAKKAAGKAAGKPATKAAGKPAKKAAGKAAGKPAKKAAGKPAKKAAGKAAGKPATKAAGKPARKAARQPGVKPPEAGEGATPGAVGPSAAQRVPRKPLLQEAYEVVRGLVMGIIKRSRVYKKLTGS